MFVNLQISMRNFILILIFIFCFGVINAQSNEDLIELLRKKELITSEDIDSININNQSKGKNTLQKIKTALTESELFKLSAYGQALYSLTENPAENSPNNSMKINRVIFFATGNLNKYLSYMIMYDFGPKAALHELYGEFTPIDALSVRFGQYKIPFTIENPMSPTRWEGIYGSLSVNGLAGISTDVIGAKAGRDMGLQLSGKLLKREDGDHYIEYAAGLFNGTGFNTSDNNNHKDFAGTLFLKPIKGLKVAGSLYSGKAPYAIGNEIEKNHVRNRWSAGGEYDSRHFYARSEYLRGNDGGLNKEGYYGVGMWKIIHQKLDIFGKYDYFNEDKNTNLNDTYEITGGVNFYFGYLSRIQLNYIYTDNKITGTNNTIATQLQLFF